MAHAVFMMSNRLQNNGFSLTEVLMAAGILAIGFAFIAGMFPVGVKLTAIATEQTIAPIVVDEAIAKMKLYVDPIVAPSFVQSLSTTEYRDFSDIASLITGLVVPDEEFKYPSVDISPELKKYHWSALCGLLSDGNVHVIIFVSRKAGGGAKYLYYDQNNALQTDGDWPVPVKVQVTKLGPRRLSIPDSLERAYINAGCTIVDDFDGSRYRVLGRGMDGDPENVIRLDREWRNLVVPSGDFVWVVPPAEGSGRNPCIGVYQARIGF